MEGPMAGIQNTVNGMKWYAKERRIANALYSLQRLRPSHQLPGKRQSLRRPTNLLKVVELFHSANWANKLKPFVDLENGESVE
jgi:hypothetical protein